MSTQEKTDICKPRRDLRRRQPAHTLTSDLQPPELEENELLLFKLPCLGSFVTAALAASYTSLVRGNQKWDAGGRATQPTQPDAEPRSRAGAASEK